MVRGHVGRMVQVVDADALARVVRALLERRPGTWQELGNTFGEIEQTTWAKLARADTTQMERIREVTLDRLDALAQEHAPELTTTLQAAVIPPQGRELLTLYAAWIQEQFARHLYFAQLPIAQQDEEGGLSLVVLTDDDVDRENAPLQVDELGGELTGLAALRWNWFQVVLANLLTIPACAEAINEFVEEARANGHEEGVTDASPREMLAIFRAVEPLLAAPECGYMERAASEMSEAELAEFVRAGLVRERIMLNRPPDLQRMQAVLLDAAPFFKADPVKTSAKKRTRGSGRA